MIEAEVEADLGPETQPCDSVLTRNERNLDVLLPWATSVQVKANIFAAQSTAKTIFKRNSTFL